MYISRLSLRHDPGAAGSLAALLAERIAAGTAYDAHRLVWSLFGCTGDQERDFLFRQTSGPGEFIAVSARAPTDRHDLWRIETKPYDPQVRSGERLAFSLRANPVVKRIHESGKPQRADVVMDLKWRLKRAGAEVPSQPALVEQAGLDWLTGRSARHGFAIEPAAVRVDGYIQHRFETGSGGQPIRLSSLDFDGVLTVIDPGRFRAALFSGIGPAKAFGFGLLLIRRV
ncbi:MAG TPA: type I-E CRISPR-associated protein Cas6/Cse3/CasE [Hyphomicrobiaceae bacterium]|nr:type I-E CRISPR-associated protein Cas6/Cse3/CasE [Hyphomicrobiaceae bacterium]